MYFISHYEIDNLPKYGKKISLQLKYNTKMTIVKSITYRDPSFSFSFGCFCDYNQKINLSFIGVAYDAICAQKMMKYGQHCRSKTVTVRILLTTTCLLEINIVNSETSHGLEIFRAWKARGS